MVVIKNEMRIF